jgi:6-pyruvoyl-tetrahydropterin synthase
MSDRIFDITKTAQFDAAHRLPDGPKAAYQQLHGHSFQVEATVRGVMGGPVGWVADLGDLEAKLSAVAKGLYHGLLNEHPGLEPDAGFSRSRADRRVAPHSGRTLRPGAVARLRPGHPAASSVSLVRPDRPCYGCPLRGVQ